MSSEPVVSSRRMTGIGRVLVILYAIMALGATGRSFVQVVEKFDQAPVAYSLSAVAAVVYIIATLALVLAARPGWYTVAWIAVSFELIGVIVIGTLSITMADLFAHDSVWSFYGRGYVWIPLVLPILGLWWLTTHRPASVAEAKA